MCKEIKNKDNESTISEAVFYKYQRDQRKWLIIFAVVTIAVLIIIVAVSLLYIDSSFIISAQNSNESVNRNIDYLQFVVPVLLAIGAFMAAVLGMNRLKSLDDEVDRIDNRLSRRFDDLESNNDSKIDTIIQKKINDTSSAFERKLQESVDIGKTTIEGLVEEKKAELCSEKKNAIVDVRISSEEIKNSINGISQKIDSFSTRFGWLKSIGEGSIKDIDVSSVSEAHIFVEKLLRDSTSIKSDQVSRAKIIVNKVLGGSLPGDRADYHNLSAELARNEMKDDAIHICKSGLKLFPDDVDLLADIIQYSSQIGKNSPVKTEEYVDKLNNISKNSWTWRCFEFLADYYISLKEYEEAELICKDYVQYYPRDERGYAEYSEVYGYLYSGEEAENKKINILKRAVEKGFPCPRCANELSEIYANRGELEQAILYSKKAILSLAQVQPSINYAFVFYNKALFEDRLFLLKYMEGLMDNELAMEALNDYETALESGLLTVIISTQAKVRYNIIAGMIGKDKYSSTEDSAAKLLSLLSKIDATKSDDE